MKAKLGFTLIEVMVAIFLVALGAIMYSALMPMAAKGSRMVSNYQQASSLVQNKIDEVRAVGYGRINYANLQAAGIIDATPTSSPYSFTGVAGLASIFPGAAGTISISERSRSTRRGTRRASPPRCRSWSGCARRSG